MKNIFLFSILVVTEIFLSKISFAQTNTFPSTGAAGIGTTTPNASSLLDVTSATQGVLVPRMTKTQRDAIVSPATGLLIYQTNSTPGFYYYSGTSWTAVTPAGGANKSLGNLTSPTAVNQFLLPNASGTLDLGSSTLKWRDTYTDSVKFADGTIQTTASAGWTLTGNAGTNASANFIGTTDNVAFKIRTNNAVRITVTGSGKVGIGNTSPVFKLDVKGGSINTDSLYRIGGNTVLSVKGTANTFVGTNSGFSNTTGSYNTANGLQALFSNTTGIDNTAIGYHALYSNTTGTENTANGFGALYLNTAGADNTANGFDALFSNTTGNFNSANGYQALYSNTTGGANTASGYGALYSNTTGGDNTANGYGALLSNTTGFSNTANGYGALFSNTTGYYNTVNGVYALFSNTTGNSNSANGYQALYSNTTGGSNTANGVYALYSNTIGTDNTADGFAALSYNTSGIENTATGENALYSNTTSNYNTANGNGALYSNTTGNDNTAIGRNAMYFNTSGYENSALGTRALYNNSTGYDNTAIGRHALYNNTTGLYNSAVGVGALFSNDVGLANTASGYQALYSNTSGEGNTANGDGVLYSNTTGYDNTANGYGALFSNTTGVENTANGFFALYSNTTGNYNTSVGYDAGLSLTTGSSNTFIGTNADCGTSGTLTNSTAIGNLASATSSNIFVFGNSDVVGWGFGVEPGSRAIKVGTSSSSGNGAYLTQGGVWTDISDRSKKENITEPDKNAMLEKILQLKITQWKYKGTKNEYHIGPMADDFHRLFEVGDDSSISSMDKTGVLFLGMQALSERNDQLSMTNDQLISKVQNLQSENDEMKSRITALENKSASANLPTSSGQAQSAISSDGFAKVSFTASTEITLLGQNIPNPFDNSTLIPFRIPKDCRDASIMIANNPTSEVISVIPISCNEDHISIDAGTLASGSYSYTLYVDGKMIDTRQMVLTK